MLDRDVYRLFVKCAVSEKKYQHGRCVDRKSRNTSTRWAGGYYVTAALTRLNEFDDYKTHCYVDRLVLLLTTAKEGLDVISYWWREGYECKGVKRYRFFFSLSLCTGGEMRLLAAFICPHDVMSQTNSRQPPFSPLVSLHFSARLKTCRNCNDWLATIRRKLLRLCCKDISVDDEWTRRRSKTFSSITSASSAQTNRETRCCVPMAFFV